MAAKKASASPKAQTKTKAAAKTAPPEPEVITGDLSSPVLPPDAPKIPPDKPASEAKMTAGTVTETVSQRQAISDPTVRPDSDVRREMILGTGEEPQRPAEVVNPFPTLETADKATLTAAGKLPDGWMLVHAVDEKPVHAAPVAAVYRATKTINSTQNEQVAESMDDLVAKCEDVERFWAGREVAT